ncbi:hypothetical protein [Rhodopila globiformis]|uniref:Uncharacterized protein n=1 Tax=Rhodopila globiformis TaxID=1071 RepID=A0A2S6NBF1_RHOGL|nr:hypothetical protein [Rhodopila globiformis]PPQ31927.1 hypothetical protein CCS01_16265 [Rhodopila globiformis]
MTTTTTDTWGRTVTISGSGPYTCSVGGLSVTAATVAAALGTINAMPQTPTSTPATVVNSVAAWQGKIVLISMPSAVNAGKTLYDDASAWIATQSTALQIAWANAPTWTRDGTMIPLVAAGIGLTDAQVDQMFLTASAISG